MEIIAKGQAFAKGLKTFFTGKPCPHGHTAERLVFNSKCVECIRIERERSKQRLTTGPRVVLPRMSVAPPVETKIETPRVVQEPTPPPPLPDIRYSLPVDPSIAHLFDRGLNHMPLRARPGCELAHAEKPKKRATPDKTGGSKRATANLSPPTDQPRARKPKREEMYGPFRPRGNPNWYKKLAQAPETKPVAVPPPPKIISEAIAPKVKAPAPKPEADTKKEVRRLQQRIDAQNRARAKMDRLMQFATGNW